MTAPPITGEAYVEAIGALDSDRRARMAFHDFAAQLTGPPATIFDFGAGPGTDALYYAQRGFKVAAFDHDPEMRASFRMRCHSFIESGQVALQDGDYEEFLASPSPFAGGIDLVTANFAPFSMIADLRPLFRKLHGITRPGARLIASVLNPNYLAEYRNRAWWRRRLEYLRNGAYYHPGPARPVHLRSPRVFSELAAPWFRMTEVRRGMPLGAAWRLPVLRQLGQFNTRFLFISFERN